MHRVGRRASCALAAAAILSGLALTTVAAPPAAAAPSPTCTPTLPSLVTRPDLHPPAACVAIAGTGLASGYLLTTIGGGAGANDGPSIFDDAGHLVWFHPTEFGSHDLEVTRYDGRRVLAYFEPASSGGDGRFVLLDKHYHQVGTVWAHGAGYSTDDHELDVLADGTALIGAYVPAVVPAGQPGAGTSVLDYVVQRVDVATGAVLFEWHALDHVPITESETGGDDFFHGNAISLTPDGDLLISARNTSTVYDVNPANGAIRWRLGGKSSTFPTLGTADEFCFQHDARMPAPDVVTLFDNGGTASGCPKHDARAMEFDLDPANHTYTVVQAFGHDPGLSTDFVGSRQSLPNGDILVSWGNRAIVSEIDGTTGAAKAEWNLLSTGDISTDWTYRVRRAVWHGYPTTRPAITVAPATGGGLDVTASWNGATEVTAWQVLAGRSLATLAPVGTPVTKSDFETTLHTARAPLVAVRALDAKGATLGESAPVVTGAWFHELPAGDRSADYHVVVGDFGGPTHDDDLILFTPSASQPDWFVASNGRGGWRPAVRLPQIARGYRPLVGHLTGTARDDVLWWVPWSRVAYLQRGDRPVTSSWQRLTVPAVPHALVLHHDHRLGGPRNDEVLWWKPASGGDSIEHVAWPAHGTLSVTFRTVSANGQRIPVSGDFDGDGWADVAWYGPGSGPDAVWSLGGTDRTTRISRHPVTLPGTDDRLVAGRFAGADQRDDLLVVPPGPDTATLWVGRKNRTFGQHDTGAVAPGGGRLSVLRAFGSDRLSVWVPGSDVVLWSFNPTTGAARLRAAGNSVLGPGYQPYVGRFTGASAADIYWFAAGFGAGHAEWLWQPWLH